MTNGATGTEIDQITEIVATLKPIRTAAMLISAWNPLVLPDTT
jgi:thymidylate synthase